MQQPVPSRHATPHHSTPLAVCLRRSGMLLQFSVRPSVDMTSSRVLCCAVVCGVLLGILPAATTAARGRAGFGDRCTNASDCNPLNSECINNKCACNSSDVQTSSRCLLPVGAKCRHRPCDADNSECIVGICNCKPDFIQAYNNTFCYKIPKYDDFCEKDHDCRRLLGDGGQCNNGRCRCSATTAIDDNVCKKKIDELDARCNSETEVCYLERNGDNQRVECKNQICTCKGKFKPSPDKLSCGAGTLEALSLAASFMTLLLAKAMV